jgi:hypothetical protein
LENQVGSLEIQVGTLEEQMQKNQEIEGKIGVSDNN